MDQAAGPAGEAPAGPGRRKVTSRLPFRLYGLSVALVLTVAWIAVGLIFATVESFYPGAGAVFSYTKERPVVGDVGECRRAGPLSLNGLGYWWECRVRIRTDDGREVQTVLRHSIVSPADAGRPVELREVCSGGDNTDCRYGRPVHRAFSIAMAFLNLFELAVNVAFIFLIGIYLLGAVVGERRYDAVIARVRRQGRSAS